MTAPCSPGETSLHHTAAAKALQDLASKQPLGSLFFPLHIPHSGCDELGSGLQMYYIFHDCKTFAQDLHLKSPLSYSLSRTTTRTLR